jgi:hypothetical protein
MFLQMSGTAGRQEKTTWHNQLPRETQITKYRSVKNTNRALSPFADGPRRSSERAPGRGQDSSGPWRSLLGPAEGTADYCGGGVAASGLDAPAAVAGAAFFCVDFFLGAAVSTSEISGHC